MNTYIIHGQTFKGNVTLQYDESDRLRMIILDTEMTDEQHSRFIRQIPLFEKDFLYRAERSGIHLSVQPPDLSFEVFWKKYDYKVGNKQRTEKLWNTLSDAEKVSALRAVPFYNNFLGIKRLDKAYPETWLNQKRFLTN